MRGEREALLGALLGEKEGAFVEDEALLARERRPAFRPFARSRLCCFPNFASTSRSAFLIVGSLASAFEEATLACSCL